MFVRIYRTNNPILGFSLLLIAALLWLASLINGKEVLISGNQMPLYTFFYSFLGANKIVAAIISILMIVGEGILLNITISQFHLVKGQNYLPALFYVLVMSSFPEIHFLHPVLFANIFLIFTMKRCFDLLGSAHSGSVAFDSAFFASIASLFYFPSVIFLFFILVALMAFRPFSLKNWTIALIGIIVPYLFAGVYYYWFDESDLFWNQMILQPIISKTAGEISFLKSFYTLFFFLLLLVVLAVPPLLTEIRRNKASIRSGLRLFIWFAFFSLLSVLLAPDFSLYHFCLAAIPLAMIYTNLFLNLKTAMAETLFSFLLFFLIIYQINFF